MNNNYDLLERQKNILLKWEEEFKSYLYKNITKTIELYPIDKKWYEDYKKSVFSDKIKINAKINNYNTFQPMDYSNIIYNQNTINPDSNFILLNKECMDSFSPSIYKKSQMKLKITSHIFNNKIISRIGKNLYYFFYSDEIGLLKKGFFIFGDIDENKINEILLNFLNNNIDSFIKHYFNNSKKNLNKNKQSELYHRDEFDLIFKINDEQPINRINEKFQLNSKHINLNDNQNNNDKFYINISNNNNTNILKKKFKNKRNINKRAVSPKNKKLINNNIIINFNYSINDDNKMNFKRSKSVDLKVDDNIIECIYEYFCSQNEYKNFINSNEQINKIFIPINKNWIKEFLIKTSYESIKNYILKQKKNIKIQNMIDQYLIDNNIYDIEMDSISPLSEITKYNNYKYFNDYELITKNSYKVFSSTFGNENKYEEFRVFKIDYNYIFIKYNQFSAEIKNKNETEKYFIYSDKYLEEIKNNILKSGLINGLSLYGVHLNKQFQKYSLLNLINKVKKKSMGILIIIKYVSIRLNNDNDEEIINNDENVYENKIAMTESNPSNSYRSRNSSKVKQKNPRFNAVKIKTSLSPSKISLKKNINYFNTEINNNYIFINTNKEKEIEKDENEYNIPNSKKKKNDFQINTNIQKYNRDIPINSIKDSINISYNNKSNNLSNITKVFNDNQQNYKTPDVKVKKIENFKHPPKPNNMYENYFIKIPQINLNNNIENEEIINISPKGLVGLLNIGAICYMNATIQCFSNISRFREALLNNELYQELYYHKDDNNKLSFALADVFKNLWMNKTIKHFSPNYFKELISVMNPLFKGIVANDSKEFILFILETIHNELNKNFKGNYIPNSNNLDFFSVFKDFTNYYKSNNQSIISEEFYGYYDSMLKCCSCNIMAHNIKVLNILFFPLEQVRKFIRTPYNFVTLENCFHYYEASELLKYENQIFCNYCKKYSKAFTQNKIIISPRTLIINLNRGKGLQYMVGIKFGQFLDLKKYIFNNQSSPYYYELVGVISHFGTSDMGGHFIAYCKNSYDNEWYKYNDAQVDKSSFNEITSVGSPYVLFYSFINK